MTSQALDTYFVRAGNIPSISKRYQACVEKANEEGITLFGMDDKRCWTAKKPERTFDKFGSSGHCKEKGGYSSGMAERSTVYVYRKNDKGNKLFFKKKFCWKRGVNLPHLICFGREIKANL